MMIGALLFAWLVYGLLTAIRVGLALRFLAHDRRQDGAPRKGFDEGRVTVMQAILSGDPTLGRNLEENLRHHPRAGFLWLVDEDDPVARELTRELAERLSAGRVEILVAPPPPQGRNPKVFKLALGLPRASGDLIAVLDDDTVLRPGGLARAALALDRGDLATGLPCYRLEGSFASRLVAAFVNANALLTYLPILSFRAPVTINGMFYLTRRETLERLGGFAAIEDRLCDDYEMARLYRLAGLRIVQTSVLALISTSVRGAVDYARTLRRWMIFANHLFRDAIDLPMLVLVVLPALMPLLLVVLAAFAGAGALAATIAGLVAKASMMALFRRFAIGSRESAAGVALEVLADILQPFHAASALIRPGSIRWRSRSIRIENGKVRYP